MKAAWTCAALFIAALSTNAQTKTYLWPGAVPGETEAKHEPVLSANQSGNVKRTTNVTNPAILAFQPQPSLNNGYSVVVCPGGGYETLATDKEGSEIAQWFNKMGYTAFVLEYRTPQKRLGALQDLERAMRVIKSNAAKWKIDPDKLGVIGFSAGADMAAKLSTQYDKNAYTPADDLDKLPIKPAFAMIIYPGYLNDGPNRTLTPELSKMDANTPTTFVFQAADDGSGGSSVTYALALQKAKAPVEFHLVPKGGHGYGLRAGNPAAEVWPTYAEAWLKANVLVKK
ncbi:alpha/beta hydrolase [Mucilaginibacter calamicampi]|uniref:Alpha/beta hydrolase n=1 Tax=Mucilaginibacter calamicampi TaxID=1302352 RepID=A0ABW2YU62_9SPHI